MAKRRKTQPGSSSDGKSQSSTRTSRRKLLKSLAGAGGVAATAKAVPPSWTQPMVDAGIVPAHAQGTVGCQNAGEGNNSFTVPMGTPTTFDVPDGVCEVFVTVSGAQGGGGGGSFGEGVQNGQDGLPGQVVITSFNVSAGQTLFVSVGGGGIGGAGGQFAESGSGGAGGSGGGESGGLGLPSDAGAGGGGGGGGASRIFEGGTEFALAPGGAGGAGGDNVGGEGGAGGEGGPGGSGVFQGDGSGSGGAGGIAGGESGDDGAAGSAEIAW